MSRPVVDAAGGYRVFDVHAHIGDLAASRTAIALMDRSGISAGVAMLDHAYEWPNGIADTRRVNDQVAALRQRLPERLPVALGTLEPFHGQDAGLAEIERIVTELHLDGLVWDHHAQGTGIDDQRMVAFVQELARRGLPAFIHANALDMRESPAHIESLAQRVPEARIVALGALSALQRESELRRIAEGCPNLVFDTTVTLPIGPIERYVGIVGAERLVFGTDMYANPTWASTTPPVLDNILRSEHLSDQDKRRIVWDNAARLFPALESFT